MQKPDQARFCFGNIWTTLSAASIMALSARWAWALHVRPRVARSPVYDMNGSFGEAVMRRAIWRPRSAWFRSRFGGRRRFATLHRPLPAHNGSSLQPTLHAQRMPGLSTPSIPPSPSPPRPAVGARRLFGLGAVRAEGAGRARLVGTRYAREMHTICTPRTGRSPPRSPHG